MTGTEESIPISEITINDLAFRSLNTVPREPSSSSAQALDRLENTLRQGSLAIAVALHDVADAIRDATETKP